MEPDVQKKKTIDEIKENGNLVLFSQLIHIESISENLVNDSILLVIVIKGNAHIVVDNGEIELKASDMLIIKQSIRYKQCVFSKDIDFRAIYIPRRNAEELILKNHISWTDYSMFTTYYKTNLLQNDLDILKLYFDLIEKTTERGLNGEEFLKQAFLHGFLNIMDPYFGANYKLEQSTNNSILEKFLRLVSQTKPTPHTVEWYAQELHITAKYLSTLCKNTTGKSPRIIIENEIFQQAKELLENSSYNINQISDILDFSNQSHFGTFIRKISGKSPKQIRQDVHVQKRQ